jgi:integrase
MKTNSATTSLILDTRKQLTDGTYPVKLRVTYKRKSNLYSIGKYNFSKADWKTITTTNPRKNLREQKVKINLIQGRAQEIIESLHEFSFELFSSAWKGKTVISTNLGFEQCMNARINQSLGEGRISTGTNIKTILNSFMEFFEGRNPDLRELKPDTFRQYQDKLISKGKSPATVGIYTREIRTMYNDLINNGILESQYYPFGKSGFKPPSAKKLKTALMKEDIRKIVAYDADTSSKEAYCRDLWVFSYLCNGMNIKDIASLKYSNIKEDFIFFNRAKTKRTKTMAETISVPLLPIAKEIIQRWGNPNRKTTNFIFPIFNDDSTPEDQRRLIQNASHLITDHIKRIAQKLDLPKKDITANTARDAFATVSMHEGRPISDISDSLGHSSISVTEHYLAGFANSTKMEWQKQLL